MASFYVGQRVKKVRGTAANVGVTGVYVGPSAEVAGGILWRTDAPVLITAGPNIGQRMPAGTECRDEQANMEPLAPPPQLIAWDEACFDRDGKYRQEVRA